MMNIICNYYLREHLFDRGTVVLSNDISSPMSIMNIGFDGTVMRDEMSYEFIGVDDIE